MEHIIQQVALDLAKKITEKISHSHKQLTPSSLVICFHFLSFVILLVCSTGSPFSFCLVTKGYLNEVLNGTFLFDLRQFILQRIDTV